MAEITRKQLKTNGRKQTDTYQYNVSEYVYMDKKVWIRKIGEGNVDCNVKEQKKIRRKSEVKENQKEIKKTRRR